MQRTRDRGARKWWMFVFCLTLGLAFMAAGWAGGQPVLGVTMMAVMAVYGAVLLLGGRSEVVRVLRAEPSDERWQAFDVRASAVAGGVAVVGLFAMMLYEFARGGSGMTYALLLGLFGISYFVALLVLRERS